jgi:hypothetical protein
MGLAVEVSVVPLVAAAEALHPLVEVVMAVATQVLAAVVAVAAAVLLLPHLLLEVPRRHIQHTLQSHSL